MNQILIEGLATHADFYVGNEHSDKSYQERDRLWVEMYTKLVIQECITITKNWEDELENSNSLSESNAVGIVAYRIARQFGVEK